MVDFFGGEGVLGGQFNGTPRGGVAVNDSGVGSANAGDVYVVDTNSNRIERFGRDDNGTAADAADDTYFFISAWGADVDAAPAGGSGYEICTVAEDCKAAAPSGGNGTLTGDGSLAEPKSVAIDQDTGEVYVSDAGNSRIDVYEGDGTFLRSFGWDVVASGPDQVSGDAYEVCRAGLDVCKQGVAGAGLGALGEVQSDQVQFGIAVSQPDGNTSTGTVFVADAANRRVDTYGLDGAAPGTFGSAVTFAEEQPKAIAVDSRGIVYASNAKLTSQVERYDAENADGGGVGFLAPIPAGVNEEQQLTIDATAGQFRLSFEAQTTGDLPFNATSSQVQTALEALSSVGGENVRVSDGPDSNGLHPYRIEFTRALGARNVGQIAASDGTAPLAGGAGASVATLISGQSGLYMFSSFVLASTYGLAIAPDPDGAGPESDILYSARAGGDSIIQQFGPLNAPGLSAPPATDDDRHFARGLARGGIAVEPSVGRIYVPSNAEAGSGVYVLGEAGPPPTASLDSLSGVTSHGVTAHATVDPNGPPDTSYRFEYSRDGGAHWSSTPTKILGHQEDPQPLDELIDPPPAGLLPNTSYQVRLVVVRKFAPAITTPPLSFATDPAKPLVETTGTSVRTTTTAQLQGRVDPNGSATTYHFEYGSQGPCEANPCASTAELPAGSGQEFKIAAEDIEGLEPNTTYHYRLVADNDAQGSATAGVDATLTTRASDAPLTHGHFPGPPGSDRAWELVSMPDSGGNPAALPLGFSDDGDHAAYQIAGGTPISEAGSLFGLYYAKRTPSGWQSSLISPKRAQLVGPSWFGLYGDFTDFSRLSSVNGGDNANNKTALWSMSPGGEAAKLFEPNGAQEIAGERVEGAFGVSADGRQTVALLAGGTLDPAFPSAALKPNLYDVSNGSPHLVSLLPGDTPATCGVEHGNTHAIGSLEGESAHWLSGDGSYLYFESKGDACQPTAPARLYVRNLDSGETKLIGPGVFLKSISGAAFFTTERSLDPDDGGGNDVYRYDLEDENLKCLTCVVPGLEADVNGTGANAITVAEDGSRIYFETFTRLLPGAPDESRGTYSLNVASGKLHYVAAGVSPGYASANEAFSRSGRFFAFASQDPELNPLGGAFTNGGGIQYYVYDDEQGSLVCASCPADGSAPLNGLQAGLVAPHPKTLANLTPLAEDGTLAFVTSTPLLAADQNTPPPNPEAEADPYFAGSDVYEWRDGRQLLVSDGLLDWSGGALPEVQGVSPSGRDVYFAASAQYTPDALDAFRRFYDARIGGGIEFPPPKKPCPLEVCQGTPRGEPEEQEPASANFRGLGNTVAPRPGRRPCPKGRSSARGRGASRCAPRHPRHRGRHHKRHRRANPNRRNAR